MKQTTPFGKYLLLDRVNVGGMAEVFKAKAFGVEGFERILAIKRILPNMADDDEFINMFVDEARIAVQLSHANIVQIFELGKWENQYYIAMEYVAGKDVRQILDNYRKRKELLPLPAVAFLASKICDGLDYAHRKADPSGRPMNVIHRDVSPQNILVGYEGAVKITDFGIVKAEDRASKTQAGVLKGKFGYMSPEQVRGMEIDHRSDIFAVGILLYEMTTGKRLFVGESDFSTLEKVRNAEVVAPREHNPDLPEELERIVLKALARERDERYLWASDLHDDLQQFLIEGNTIFNAKKLAVLMQEVYGEEIKEEATKMEEFMRAQAPASMKAQIEAAPQVSSPQSPHPPGQGSASAGGDEPWAVGEPDRRDERTMIFESGFNGLAEAPTQVGESVSEAVASNTGVRPVHLGGPGSRSGVSHGGTGSRPQVSVVATAPRPVQQRTHTGAIIGAMMAFLVLLGALAWLLFVPGGKYGEIEVSWTPPVDAKVILDGVVVGTRTPLRMPQVEVGKHTLSIRATGYETLRYGFTLNAQKPAVVPIRLVPTSRRAVKDATLTVITTPIGAEVLLGGNVVAQTPANLTQIDSSVPTFIELRHVGYQPMTTSVQFSAQERLRKSKIVQFTLSRIGATRPGSLPTPPTPPSGTGTIVVNSIPEGATVFLSNTRQGTTPMEIKNLSTVAAHHIVITLSGHRKWTKLVRFAAEPVVYITADLEVLRRKGTTPITDKPHKKPTSGGGKCGGNAGKVTVAARGQADCKVSIGSTQMGFAPFFAKPSPSGACKIKVKCPSGKSWEGRKKIGKDGVTKIVIESNMFK